MTSVFGVPIEGLSQRETIARVKDATRPFWIVTTNPEILLAARRDPTYAETLRRADMRLVDGFGLWIILRIFGMHTCRIPGVELAESLMQEAVQENWKIAMIGGAPQVAEQAANATRRAYPSLTIHAEHGGNVSFEGSDDTVGANARMRLTQFAPEILFVAFGHPKQERWIEKYLQDFPSVKAVIGIGGTLDYWAGTQTRAPIWMRSIGFEWLWRLMCEPRRWKRIWNAVVVFPILAIQEIPRRRL